MPRLDTISIELEVSDRIPGSEVHVVFVRGSKIVFSFLKLHMHGKIQGDPLYNRVGKFQTTGRGEERKNPLKMRWSI